MPWLVRSRGALLGALLVGAAPLAPAALLAQGGTGTVTGVVSQEGGGRALSGVSVRVAGGGASAVTGTNGRYTLYRVPAGEQTIVFRWVGYQPVERPVTVAAGESVTLDAALTSAPVVLSEVTVQSATRRAERIVEAPAAVSDVSPQVLDNTSITAQAPIALQSVPGVDVVQSGVNDFNVNSRGFNSTLNRRMLVLQDGRDLAIAFLGSQEWNGLAVPLEDVSRIEVVRGPGSALYGANAFSGVVSITTPAARDIVGTKLTLGGGELSTLRGDLRHAGVLGSGRLGYRVNAGYARSESWTRSRTQPTSLAQEYAEASEEAVAPQRPEALPLRGQTLDPVTRAPVGEADDLQSMYGSARLDLYGGRGVGTLEGGLSQVENEVFVTGIGRVQVGKARKPYVRAAYGQERFNLMGYWSGRLTTEPQRSLAAGIDLLEDSDIFHLEGQVNQDFGERFRVVVGSSARQTRVNTSGTLIAPANDDRSDELFSGYAQLEVRPSSWLRLVGAARVDDGTLFEPQFSPKAAVVVSPNEDHSFRVTVNRAFQTPNYSEFFLRVPAGAPANFTALETGLRASPLGPALAGVPVGQLFTQSNAVPILALGNANLEVETVVGWEAGYKASLTRRLFFTADVYLSNIDNFVTDLLPAVNPAYAPWTAPEQVPAGARPQLEGAVRQQLTAAGQGLAAAGLSRVDGNTAVVLSYTNAGKVEERGFEVGLGYQFTDELRADVSFSGFDFEIKEQATGDQLVPNTPSKKGSIALSYASARGLDLGASVRLVDGYPWAAGVFQGYVPSSELVNVTAGFRLNNNFRIHAAATNVLDQRRYQMFGGSVIGRRVLGGITATF